MKQIPGTALANAEIERQKIRDKYAKMQNEIDQINDLDQLKPYLNLLSNS
jgi:hypothetical protein